MEQKDLLGMTIEELKQFAVELGEAPFRGKPNCFDGSTKENVIFLP